MTGASEQLRTYPDPRIRGEFNRSRLNTEKIVCHEHKFVYATVPKVASRSILAALRQQDFETEMHRLPLARLYDDGIIDETYTAFSFVRNPWSRIRSTYTNKIAIDDPEVHKHILQYYPGLEAGMSFKDFLDYVRWAKGGGDVFGDRHWISQHLILELPDNLPSNVQVHIGRIESLQQDFDRIIEIIGLPPIELPSLNTRFGKSKSPNQVIDHVESHRQHFDDDMIQVVAERYARDVELYEYSF